MNQNPGGLQWFTRFSLLYLVLAHSFVGAGKIASSVLEEIRVVSSPGEEKDLETGSGRTWERLSQGLDSDATSSHSLSRVCMQRSFAGLDNTFQGTSAPGLPGISSFFEADQTQDALGSMTPRTTQRRGVEPESVPNKRPPSDIPLEDKQVKCARFERTTSQRKEIGLISQGLTAREIKGKRRGRKVPQTHPVHDTVGNSKSITRRKSKNRSPRAPSHIKDGAKTKQVTPSAPLSKKGEASETPQLPKNSIPSEASKELLAEALSAEEEDLDIVISPALLKRVGFTQNFLDCDFVWFSVECLNKFVTTHLARKKMSSQQPTQLQSTEVFLKSYHPLDVQVLERTSGYLECLKILSLEYTIRLSTTYLCFLKTEPGLQQSMHEWSVDLHAGPPNLSTDKTWLNCVEKMDNYEKLMESLQGFILFNMFLLRTIIISQENPCFMIEDLETDQIGALEFVRGYFKNSPEIERESSQATDRTELMKSVIENFNLKRVHDLSWTILQDWITDGNPENRPFWSGMVEHGEVSPNIQKICFDAIHFAILFSIDEPRSIVLLKSVLH